MSNLTEKEILDRMKGCVRSAIDECLVIAAQPVSGPYFDSLRKNLKLAESCCRQAAYWREDARWLPLGLAMESAHQRARFWLHRPSVQSKKLFTKLAEVLRQLERAIVILETQKTGRRGMILPAEAKAPHRDTRPVAVSGHRVTPGGLIVP